MLRVKVTLFYLLHYIKPLGPVWLRLLVHYTPHFLRYWITVKCITCSTHLTQPKLIWNKKIEDKHKWLFHVTFITTHRELCSHFQSKMFSFFLYHHHFLTNAWQKCNLFSNLCVLQLSLYPSDQSKCLI